MILLIFISFNWCHICLLLNSYSFSSVQSPLQLAIELQLWQRNS
jgi:hypothetical protein